ncbi:MAG: hypothetical protein AAGH76_08690 [Pseudomonadota bacterium]
MNDDELRRLMQDSSVSVSAAFTHSVIEKIETTQHANPQPMGGRAWLLVGIAGLVLLGLANVFAVEAVLRWVAAVFSIDPESLDNALRRPLLIAISLFSLVGGSQLFKLYTSDHLGGLSQ